MKFISKENKKIHEEYLRDLKLKMSIFEKSYPELHNKSCREILRTKIAVTEREKAAELKAEICSHEMYFSSFEYSNTPSLHINKTWGSEANFLYEIMTDSDKATHGFIIVYIDPSYNVKYCISDDILRQFLNFDPVLAIDICEHAYFYDYRFDRREYLKAALSQLNLSKIEKYIEKKRKKC